MKCCGFSQILFIIFLTTLIKQFNRCRQFLTVCLAWWINNIGRKARKRSVLVIEPRNFPCMKSHPLLKAFCHWFTLTLLIHRRRILEAKPIVDASNQNPFHFRRLLISLGSKSFWRESRKHAKSFKHQTKFSSFISAYILNEGKSFNRHPVFITRHPPPGHAEESFIKTNFNSIMSFTNGWRKKVFTLTTRKKNLFFVCLLTTISNLQSLSWDSFYSLTDSRLLKDFN